MKLCKDCKWKSKPSFYGTYCKHKKSPITVDLVEGTKTKSLCSFMRFASDICGTEAKLFEPTIWKKVKDGCKKGFRTSKKEE